MSTLSIAYSCPLHGALGNTLVDKPDSADHLTGLHGGQVVNLWQHPVSNRAVITIHRMAFPPWLPLVSTSNSQTFREIQMHYS